MDYLYNFGFIDVNNLKDSLIMEWQNKKVCIIGAARSGVAAANLALTLGACPRITDSRDLTAIEPALMELSDRARTLVEAGGHSEAFITACDVVVASPGVWRDALPLQWARKAGIPVWGEIEFASRFCRRPIIAVTGSNGKTTTVTLMANVMEASGKRVCLCGNVGTPLSQYALREDVDFFVVEISSFQLELVETFRPFIAVILNFSQNHLDRHPDMDDYFVAKKRIFMNQTSADHALINAADEWCQRLPSTVPAQLHFFNKCGETRNPNLLAVVALGSIIGISEALIEDVFAAFLGVAHRLEKVRVVDGVEYINDSKSTTVESGRWALDCLRKPAIIIVGGSDKHLEYGSLRDLMRRKCRVLVVLGVIRHQLSDTFKDIVPVEIIDGGLEAAVLCARGLARPGECVLLSPMTASFDMFKDYEERGQVFRKIVQSL